MSGAADTSDPVASSQKLVGRVLGDKFRLTACVGIGGSGAVYRADQIALGRTVAVKVLNEALAADARTVKRFRDEAMAASRLNHPNTVSIIDYGQSSDGLLYLAMEYLRGPTLTQLLTSDPQISVDRALDIIAQTLSGIEEAHLASVVHADLKSDNIILDQRRAGADIVKIVDFGIARLITAPRDGEERTVCGTPEYMAPEVISGGQPSFASDLYGIGIILYELLVRETPFFAQSTSEILTRHIKAEPRPVSKRREGVPTEVDGLLARALAKHPRDRFTTAAQMRISVLALRDELRGVRKVDACGSCGARCSPTFKFCPECGTPRQRSVTKPPDMTAAAAAVLPLPFVGREGDVARVVEHLSSPASAASAASAASQASAAMGAAAAAAPMAHPPQSTEATAGSRTLLLSGEIGSGRSRLLASAYPQVGANNVTIYHASPDPTGLATPYYPVRSLLAAILNLPPVCGGDELAAAVLELGLTTRDTPAIAYLFGIATSLGDLEPGVRRRELIQTALRALAAAAAAGATALVFEDIDRYDRPSLEILRHLGESELTLPPALLVTEPAFAATWPLPVPRLELGALDPKLVTRMYEQLSAANLRNLPASQSFHDLTKAHADHLNHLVRFVVEGGRLEESVAGISDLIAARLSLIAQPTLQLLQAAAVLGMEPRRELLDAMLPTVAEAARKTAIADAIAHDYLSGSDDNLQFASRRVRDIVYDATPADVRRSLHHRAAEALGKMDCEVAVLGHHRDRGGQPAEAARLLMQAGDDASSLLDDTSAGQFYQRALVAVRQAVTHGDDKHAEAMFVELSVRLSEVLRLRGNAALARGVLAEARDWSASASTDAALDRAAAGLSMAEGDAESATTALRRGIGRAISSGSMAMVCELYLDLSVVLSRNADVRGAVRELAECIDIVTLGEGLDATRAPDPLWRVLRVKAQLVNQLGDRYLALRLAEAALAHAQRAKSRPGSARVQALLAVLCEQSRLSGKADRYRQGAIEQMRELGDRRTTSELLLTLALDAGKGATPAQLEEAATLAGEIGWADGMERALRNTPTMQ
jgi:eukaryotic-like serine/threonine-protein kinase